MIVSDQKMTIGAVACGGYELLLVDWKGGRTWTLKSVLSQKGG